MSDDRENIVIFGVSEYSRLFYEIACDKYDVIGFLDNDIHKQNTKFCKKPVFGIEYLSKRSIKILVVSSHYESMIRQLESLGYHNYECLASYDSIIDRYPDEVNKYINKKTSIIRSKMLTHKTNVLVLSSDPEAIYSKSMERALALYSSCVNVIGCYLPQLLPYYVPFWVDFIRHLGYFDCIDIHYFDSFYNSCIDEISRNCSKLVITIFGDEVYAHELSEEQKHVLTHANRILFSNQQTADHFTRICGNEFKSKIQICDFGLETLDHIDEHISDRNIYRRDKGIKSDDIVVMIGTNACKEQHHIEIINCLTDMPATIKRNTFLFVPVMYPWLSETKNYIAKIKAQLDVSGYRYYLTSNALINYKEVAEHRLITDVLVFMRDTDQLSGSMLETMYAGGIVISGQWLPYENLIDRGMPIFPIACFDELAGMMMAVIGLHDSKERISEFSRKAKIALEYEYKWKYCYKRWENVYLY